MFKRTMPSLAVLFFAGILAACSTTEPEITVQRNMDDFSIQPISTNAQRSLQPNALSQNHFNALVLREVNLYRREKGLAPLRSHTPLQSVAYNHSKWMADTQIMRHEPTNVRGEETASKRLKKTTRKLKTGAENLANFNACNAGNQSYESLAKRAFLIWRDSPPHRTNMLNKKATMGGVGLAYTPNNGKCGRYYITLDVVG